MREVFESVMNAGPIIALAMVLWRSEVEGKDGSSD